MKHVITEKDLADLIVEAEIDIKRKENTLKEGWSALKGNLKPMNLIRDMISSPKNNGLGISSASASKNNLMASGLPLMAAKVAGAFLVNRWMAKKSFGIARMAAGMLLTSGVTALLSKFTTKKLNQTRSNLQQLTSEQLQQPKAV